MMQHRDLLQDETSGLALVQSPEGLRSIARPDCAALIWQRAPLGRFQSWLDGLNPQELPGARVTLRPDMVRHVLTDLFHASPLPDCDERIMLIDDIAALAAMFAGLMQAPYLRLRLDVVSTDACSKFHVDSVKARLICTYRGTGTEYGFASGDDDPRETYTVPTSSPIVLRGKLWPASTPARLLHRSPQIAGTGQTRLVLILDPVDGFEFAHRPPTLH